MIKTENQLTIREYSRCELQAILMMVDQLSRLSYRKKEMYLFLKSTYTGDLEGKTFPPFNFSRSNQLCPRRSDVDLVTVASGSLDLMGTLIAQSGTEGKRYAEKDAMFCLNPEFKHPESRFAPCEFLQMGPFNYFLDVYLSQGTNEVRRLSETPDFFGTDIAIKLGIIDSVVLLEDLIVDQDCTEDWVDVYGYTQWGI